MTEDARNKKSNVGVVLVNDLGFYMKYFHPLNELLDKKGDCSFLIVNANYFHPTNTQVSPPKWPYDNPWRPPEYGKPLVLIADGKVPKDLAEMYKMTYSLDGKFGKIADLGYLCVPDIEKICQYLSSNSSILQKQAMKIMQRDKSIIDMVYTALEIQDDIKNEKLRKQTMDSYFHAIWYGVCPLPLEYGINLPSVLINRNERLRLAEGSEEKYAELVQTASKTVLDEGRQIMNKQRQQSR